MKRLIVILSAAALGLAGAAGGTKSASIPLKIGDVVDVTGTKIVCFAITSNKKDGMACVLWKGSKPIIRSYGAGLSVDGTAVLNQIKSDGTAASIFKRRLQSTAAKEYSANVGDVFGLQISDKVSLGCRVINVTSTLVERIYRGVKVSCWRATATDPLPNTYGVSISDRFAGVFRFDEKSRLTSWGVARPQPAA